MTDIARRTRTWSGTPGPEFLGSERLCPPRESIIFHLYSLSRTGGKTYYGFFSMAQGPDLDGRRRRFVDPRHGFHGRWQQGTMADGWSEPPQHTVRGDRDHDRPRERRSLD